MARIVSPGMNSGFVRRGFASERAALSEIRKCLQTTLRQRKRPDGVRRRANRADLPEPAATAALHPAARAAGAGPAVRAGRRQAQRELLLPAAAAGLEALHLPGAQG